MRARLGKIGLNQIILTHRVLVRSMINAIKLFIKLVYVHFTIARWDHSDFVISIAKSNVQWMFVSRVYPVIAILVMVTIRYRLMSSWVNLFGPLYKEYEIKKSCLFTPHPSKYRVLFFQILISVSLIQKFPWKWNLNFSTDPTVFLFIHRWSFLFIFSIVWCWPFHWSHHREVMHMISNWFAELLTIMEVNISYGLS